jgi:hypothetical protein
VGRGVLLSTYPLQKIVEALPQVGAYKYWIAAIHAFRGMGLTPRPFRDDEAMTGPRMRPEPTFINLRGGIPALQRSFHPLLWEGQGVPRVIESLITNGLDCSTLNDCFCMRRSKWWNDNQMSIFIDRAGCNNPSLKGDLLQEWDAIRAELPQEWLRALRVTYTPKVGQIVLANNSYYWKGKHGRLSSLELDVLGIPYSTGEVTREGVVGEIRQVSMWGDGVLGPSEDTFPHSEGWMLDAGKGLEPIELSNITVYKGYERFLALNSALPNCEVNWKRYVRFEIPWETVWASFKKPGIFTPHHFMTYFKALHRALPTMGRFGGSSRCRLGCGRDEHFTHFIECRKLRSFWKEVIRIMNSFGCGRYTHSKALLFFTHKWVQGELEPINRHMKGLVWLAWKFLWQQLAEIGKLGGGRFEPTKAVEGMLRMHHTAVIASLSDFLIVERDKRSGARKRCRKEQEEAEKFRVWPYVDISSDAALQYTPTYWDLLKHYKITPTDEIKPPD